MRRRLWFAVWSRFPSQPAVLARQRLSAVWILDSFWHFQGSHLHFLASSKRWTLSGTWLLLQGLQSDAYGSAVLPRGFRVDIETCEACSLPWGPAMLAWSKCTHLLSRSVWQAEALKHIDHRLTSRNLHESVAQWHHDMASVQDANYIFVWVGHELRSHLFGAALKVVCHSILPLFQHPGVGCLDAPSIPWLMLWDWTSAILCEERR